MKKHHHTLVLSAWIVSSFSNFDTAIASSLPETVKDQVNHARESAENEKSARGDYANLIFSLLVNAPEKDKKALKDELHVDAPAELKRLETWSNQSSDAEVDFIIGRFYDAGLGTDESKPASCRWMLKAAKKGHVDAQNNVAYCYEKGKGFPVSPKNALMWYKKAAAQNNADAITNLGIFYYEGKGVKKDDTKAYQLFLKSSKMGDELGRGYLNKMQSNTILGNE